MDAGDRYAGCSFRKRERERVSEREGGREGDRERERQRERGDGERERVKASGIRGEAVFTSG